MAVPIAALVAAGQLAYGVYKSQKQRREAKKLKQSNYTPPAVEEAIASSRLHSNASSPEYTRGLEKLRHSTANTIESSKRIGGTASSLQQSVADADAREKENIKDLQVADASFKAQSRNNLNSLLLTKGGYQQQSRDAYNAAKSALRGAADQNEYNAITSAAEGAIYALPDKTITNGLSGRGATTVNPRASFNTKARFQYGTYSMRGKNGLGRLSPYDYTEVFRQKYDFSQLPY